VGALVLLAQNALRHEPPTRALRPPGSLAVGIGVSGAITSVSRAVVVQPLRYDRPQELVMIWRGSTEIPPSLVGLVEPCTTLSHECSDTWSACKVSRLMRAILDGPRIDWQRAVPTVIDVKEGYVTCVKRIAAAR
jgi:hypothetical protein